MNAPVDFTAAYDANVETIIKLLSEITQYPHEKQGLALSLTSGAVRLRRAEVTERLEEAKRSKIQAEHDECMGSQGRA